MTRAPRHRVLLGLLATALALGTALVPSASVTPVRRVGTAPGHGGGHGTPGPHAPP